VAAAVVVGTGLVAAGWAAASVFESPAQREARATAPTPGPITAPVRRGDLAREVTMPITVRRADRITVPLVPDTGADVSVVTNVLVRTGDEVGAGSAVVAVDGRPRFAIPGRFAFWRDLAPGTVGPDVEQLQAGLVQAGLLSRADGSFGDATVRALTRLWARHHVTWPEPDTQPSSEPAGPEPSLGPTGAGSPGADPADTSGAVVHPSDFVVVDALPAWVVDAPEVGEQLTESSELLVERGAVEAVATVPAGVASAVDTGDGGTVTVDGTSKHVEVAHVDPPPGGDPGSANSADGDGGVETGTGADDADADQQTQVRLAPSDGGSLSDWAGRSGTASVRTVLAAADALLVPTAAVTPGGGGASSLLVRRGRGFERIRVEEVAQLDGQSAVAPIDGARLRPGDDVRVR
jgi:hypothetical protein